jgi:uncharacterized membrane protein
MIVIGSLTIGAAAVSAGSSDLSVSGPATSTSPGSTVTVSFIVNNSGDSPTMGPALRITDTPSDWNISDHSNGGGTYQEKENTWLWLSIGAETTRNPTLDLDVPSSITTGTYNISAELLNGSSEVIDTTTVQVTVKRQLRISLGDSNGMTGDNITIPVTLSNNGDSQINGPAVKVESMPSEWSVISESSDGGTWKDATNTWTWMSIQENSTISPSVTVQVPKDAEPGAYNISTEAILRGNSVDKATATVNIEENVEKEYDQDGDGKVNQISELQIAISDWSKTDNLNLTQLQILIQKWASS